MRLRLCFTFLAMLLLPLSGVVGTAHAQGADTATLTSQCSRYHTSYDVTYCVGKLFVQSDKELNDVYAKLKGLLRGDTRTGLVDIQRQWITYRNGACADGRGAIDVECNYQVNRDRTNYLRDRLRECETGTCNRLKITSKSW